MFVFKATLIPKPTSSYSFLVCQMHEGTYQNKLYMSQDFFFNPYKFAFCFTPMDQQDSKWLLLQQ